MFIFGVKLKKFLFSSIWYCQVCMRLNWKVRFRLDRYIQQNHLMLKQLVKKTR